MSRAAAAESTRKSAVAPAASPVREVGAAQPIAPAAARASEAASSSCAHARGVPLHGGLLERCESCGLVRTAIDPRFVYDSSYFVDDRASGYDFDSAFSRASDANRFNAELAEIEGAGLIGSVLDIGCATGSFLEIARARGWEVAGVEVAEFARREAERRSGAPVYASLGDIPAGRRFDVVTLHHVLEHIHEPLPFLRDEVRPRVARRLLIEVPNFNSLASRAEGVRWQDLRPEQHVFHYTQVTLAALLEAAGFRVLQTSTRWAPLWSLHSALTLVRWLPHLPAGHGAPEAPGAKPSGEAAPAAPDAVATFTPPPLVDVRSWRPPTGLRRLLSEASRAACAPIVRAIEARGLGERLIALAEPATEGA